MAEGDNGQNEGVDVKQRWCPFLNEYCLGERCALHSELTRVSGGIPQKIGLCAFNAAVMMLSELNHKTPGPQKAHKLYKVGDV